MLLIYKSLGFLFIPLIKLSIFYRLLKNKEDKKRYCERYGISKIKKPKGKIIWIHASSVGEFKSISSIINRAL